MQGWPPIDNAELRERLALDDEGFLAYLVALTGALGRREFTEEIYTRALGYPWARPPRSYLLVGEEVHLLDDLPEGERRAVLDDAPRGRWPVLAFGSNGAPEALVRKFGHLEEAQRRVLVLAGDLHDFDVGASAHPTVYGAMPGTIFPSPGTVVRASVLWLTLEQVVAMTWTEISYAFGRLDGVRFDPDQEGAPRLKRVLAYVSRLGAHRIDERVVALAAVPAQRRTAPAYTQKELLGHVAAVVLGEGADARALVRLLMDDFGAASAVIAPRLRATALRFDAPGWTVWAGDAA